MNRRIFLIILGVIQAVCAVFFVGEIVVSIFGLTAVPIRWIYYELIQIAAAIGLLLGTVLGARAILQARRETAMAEEALRAASGPVTADMLAERLEVSARTIYRDIVALQSMRIPVEGEAGVGYLMRSGYDLPPLKSEEDWDKLKDALFSNAEKFATHLDGFSEEKYKEGFVDEKYGTYRRNMDGMIEHCYYHLGQISIIRKMIAEGM